MNERYKITDIVSAVGVVIGLTIAVYELYIGDRNEVEARRHRSYEVASRVFQYESMKDFVGVALDYGGTRPIGGSGEAGSGDGAAIRKDIFQKSFPMLTRIAEIETCISSGLCDERIALAVACKPILGVGREFDRISRKISGVSQIVRERPLQRMLERCRRYEASPAAERME
jgi:hypothetical protein